MQACAEYGYLVDQPGLRYLSGYKSPDMEQSFYKDIPIGDYDMVRRDIKATSNGWMITVRYRFQGPRPGQNKISTTKADATHFMVYVEARKLSYKIVKVAVNKKKPKDIIWVDGHQYKLVK